MSHSPARPARNPINCLRVRPERVLVTRPTVTRVFSLSLLPSLLTNALSNLREWHRASFTEETATSASIRSGLACHARPRTTSPRCKLHVYDHSFAYPGVKHTWCHPRPQRYRRLSRDDVQVHMDCDGPVWKREEFRESDRSRFNHVCHECCLSRKIWNEH